MSAALNWKDWDYISSSSPHFGFHTVMQSTPYPFLFFNLQSSPKSSCTSFSVFFSVPLSKQDASHIIANLPGKEEGSTATSSNSSCLLVSLISDSWWNGEWGISTTIVIAKGPAGLTKKKIKTKWNKICCNMPILSSWWKPEGVQHNAPSTCCTAALRLQMC